MLVSIRAGHDTDPAVISTGDGALRGSLNGSTRQFRGVPYAAPPVGDRRWERPSPPEKWDKVRDATKAGRRCIQPDDDNERDPRSSEDCLYLDVTAPRSVPVPVPVMVWFHGGAFSSGAGSDYDPRRLVNQGRVVVVTVNSRLGVLGYFGGRGLQDSGTYGLADQQASLSWVKTNSAAFGGDPDRVTIFGNSSGGANVCAHMASPASQGLYSRAIIQSGSCLQEWREGVMYPDAEPLSYWTSRQQIAKSGRTAASALGCDTAQPLACLRRVPASKLLSINGHFLAMAYGTPLLPHDPRQLLREGKLHQVPVLQGNTRDEHRLFARFFDIVPTSGAGTYRSLLTKVFPNREAQLQRLYPRPTGRYSTERAWAAIGTDSSWVCPTLRATRQLSNHASVYSYEFADPHPPADPAFPSGFPTGAPHGSEVPYLFDLEPRPHQTRNQRALSDRIIKYWTTFAAYGSPTKANGWPKADSSKPKTLQLRPAGDRVIRADRTHHCWFWLGPT
ncbi:carboxylesterase/lipase family protein [Gordonia liuliyuniae]|uniref:Carboxylic ester hydrolase n=1 Tax=Gordonia liuliyuniae TaxID=2911517 RepID=A0ABS9ITG7_9ACTN|nr:carboxylesterase family protein [Gordonia liuliyuniae]MCF8588860.1 carboxylesterase family protein [Gordonia liuliyuniae]